MKKTVLVLMALVMMLAGCSGSSEKEPASNINETPVVENETVNDEITEENIDPEFGVKVDPEDGDHYVSGVNIGEKDCNRSDLWLNIYLGVTGLYMMYEDDWKVTDESIAAIENHYGCRFDDVMLPYGEDVILQLEKGGKTIDVKVKCTWDSEYGDPIEDGTVYAVWVGDFASLGMEINISDLNWNFGPEETFEDYVDKIQRYDVTVNDIRKNYIRFYERVQAFDDNEEDWDCYMNLIFDENGILDFINIGSLD